MGRACLIPLMLLLCLQGPAPARAEAREPEALSQVEACPEQDEDSGRVLPPVVVAAPRPLSSDRTGDTTEISGDELRSSSRASVVEAISQESADVYVSGRGPGIHGVASGASGGIHVRGLGGSPNSQILMVEDGVPDYQGIFGHPLPDGYSPFLIDRVEVVKGGDSVMFGTNAMAAVILMRSRWLAEDGHQLMNEAAVGSFGTIREDAGFLVRSGPLDGAAAFHTLHTDGHRTGAGGSNTVAQVAARYRGVSGLELTLRNKVFHLTGGDPGPATHPWGEAHWYDVWRNNLSLSAGLHRTGIELRGLTWLNYGRHKLYSGFLSNDLTAGASVESDLRIARLMMLTLGLAGGLVDGEVEERTTGVRESIRSQADLAFYNQLRICPLPGLQLTLGSREMVSLDHGLVFLWKGGVRWELIPGLELHARTSRNFRQPTLMELYLPYPTSNPDLKPEYSLNSDAGIGVRLGKVRAGAGGFLTTARDMIRYFGSWPTAEVVNIDRISIMGVEVHGGLEELGPFSLMLSGTWQDVGRYTRQNPDAKANFTLGWEQRLAAHRLLATLTGEWVHGLYMNNYSRDPVEDVFFLDLALRYRHEPTRVETWLTLRNLLDSRYEYIANYPMPGLNLLVGLKLEL